MSIQLIKYICIQLETYIYYSKLTRIYRYTQLLKKEHEYMLLITSITTTMAHFRN